jgi:outer membrane protein assembly factor BamB
MWQIPLHEGYGICSISRGRAFQFDRQNGRGVLLCLNSETGKEIWRYGYDYVYRDLYGYNNGPRTSPLIDGDRVYLYGVAGNLICVDAASGGEIWKIDVNQRYGVIQNFFGVASNPVVFDDKLIVMVGGSPEESKRVPPGQLDRVVGNGTGIVAFDKMTGREIYRLTDELASYSSLKLAQHNGRPWCFGFMRGGLVAFDPRSGKLDFHFPWRDDSLESVNASVPVVFGDKVFISETYGVGSALLRFDTRGSETIWKDKPRDRNKAMMTHWNTAIHHDGYIYGSSGRHSYSAELRCIDASTGKVMWSIPELTRASLLYVDDHFVCLTEDGTCTLLRADPRKYAVTSTAKLSDGTRFLLKPPVWAAPALAHGLLYLRGVDRLVCVELIRKAAK